MVEYNTVNTRLSDSQINKLKMLSKVEKEQLLERMPECLMKTIYLMNCY